MKLIHISDTHLNPQPVMDSDPNAMFRRCLEHVAKHHADADRIVVTGDLAHHGLESSYRTLLQIIDRSPFKNSQRPRLVIGNHDDRDVFCKINTTSTIDSNGFVQWQEQTDVGLFIYLDTVQAGTHAGVFCEARQQWLRDTLDNARRDRHRSAWLFMHHHPIDVHEAVSDSIGIAQQAEVQALLAQYRDIVRHLFFGHCHFSVSGTVAGIPFSCPRSTNHPTWPDLSGNTSTIGYGANDPSYNVGIIDEESHDIVVHTMEFTKDDQINWVPLDEGDWIEQTQPSLESSD